MLSFFLFEWPRFKEFWFHFNLSLDQYLKHTRMSFKVSDEKTSFQGSSAKFEFQLFVLFILFECVILYVLRVTSAIITSTLSQYFMLFFILIQCFYCFHIYHTEKCVRLPSNNWWETQNYSISFFNVSFSLSNDDIITVPTIFTTWSDLKIGSNHPYFWMWTILNHHLHGYCIAINKEPI